MKITAIIVTYNGLKWYDRCLGSLQNSDIPVHIIVVDNGSTDGSVAYIREKFPNVILIEANENLGFAKANNIGMRYALDHEADYVFLLNQDAWIVQSDAIKNLVDLSKGNPQFAILSPLQLYGNGCQIVYETKYYASQSKDREGDFISDSYFGNIKDIYETQYVCAASWFLPIKTLKTIGGFDPLFFHYGEDDNYIQRVKYHGYKVAICPKLNVCHDIKERNADYTEKNLDWRKYLLINFCNINGIYDMDIVLRGRKKNIFFQLLRFNRKLLRSSIPEYKYLKKMKGMIEESRAQNMIEGQTWI